MRIFYIFFFLFFSHIIENSAMKENDDKDNQNNIKLQSESKITEKNIKKVILPNLQGNTFISPNSEKMENSQSEFVQTAHILFHCVISPLANINSLDWRFYLFGSLRKGGVFFYYGFLNFGIGYNRSRFWSKRFSRIIGINLFQLLGHSFLYFFVDRFEKISERWENIRKRGSLVKRLLFFAFTDKYIERHIADISDDFKNKITFNKSGLFVYIVNFIFDIAPLLSFFTFDFQLFGKVAFSFNFGAFVVLSISFLALSIVKNFEGILNSAKYLLNPNFKNI